MQSGNASVEIRGQCDDGSDDSLVSSKIANAVVIKSIRFIKSIKKVELSVALKKGDTAHVFSFSRVWHVPRTILQLSSGNLAVLNVSYLVADDELVDEGLLIGRSVLEHLKVDTKRSLEENRESLDGTDFASVGYRTIPKNGGYVSRIMALRDNQLRNSESAGIRSSIN